jgi:hypothetical protein
LNYTQLIASKATAGSLKNWINRDTIDPVTILDEAQQLIYTTLRHWKMKAEATGAMVIGDPFIALPADFIDARDLRITGIYAARIRKGDERSIGDRYQYDSAGVRINEQPRWFYLSGMQARFDNPADIAYPYFLPYYARPAPLAGGNLTNFLTTDAPRLLRTACMLIACEFEKEVGQGQFDRTYWQGLLDKQLTEFQGMSDVADFAFDAGPDFGWSGAGI